MRRGGAGVCSASSWALITGLVVLLGGRDAVAGSRGTQGPEGLRLRRCEVAACLSQGGTLGRKASALCKQVLQQDGRCA